MKKFLALLFTLLLSLSCFGVVACGAEDNTDDNTDTTGDQTPQTVYTITEEEFVALSSIYACQAYKVSTQGYVVEQDVPQNVIDMGYAIINENGFMVNSIATGRLIEMYCQKTEDGYFGYEKEGEVFTKKSISEQEYLQAKEMFLTSNSPFVFFQYYVQNFSNLTYNQSEKCYEYLRNATSIVPVSYDFKFYFENSKLVKITYVAKSEEVEGDYYTISYFKFKMCQF